MRFAFAITASAGLLGFLVSLGACTTSATAAGPAASATGACAPEWPARLSVSAGGRVALPRTADVTPDATVEASGVTALVKDGIVSVRAPAEAAEDLSVTLHCAASVRTVAVDVRPVTWEKLAGWEEATGAPAREYGAFWLDEQDGGGLVVFGGFHYVPKQFTPANDAWRFDFAAKAWSPLAAPSPSPFRSGARAARIPGARGVYLFGGSVPTTDGAVDTPPSLFRIDHDKTSLRHAEVAPLGAAPGSYTGAFVYDSKRQRWLSLCGADSKAFEMSCRVDAFTEGAGFRPIVTTGKEPDGRYGFHYAYDEETDRVVLFGGQVGTENDSQANDTWALELAEEPARWVALVPSQKGPTKRRNGAFVLDPIGHRLLVWGGTPDGRVSVPGLQSLSLDRGAEAWSELAVPAEVPVRTSGLAIHDPAGQRVVMGFGNGKAIYRDLWALDVANAR